MKCIDQVLCHKKTTETMNNNEFWWLEPSNKSSERRSPSKSSKAMMTMMTKMTTTTTTTTAAAAAAAVALQRQQPPQRIPLNRASPKADASASIPPAMAAPRFSPLRALENARIIDRTVSLMLRDSRLVRDRSSRRSDDGNDDDNDNDDDGGCMYGIFDRDEIRTGRVLGRGGFSEVREVEAFHLRRRCRRWSKEQEAARELYARNARKPNGEARFCIKFIKPCLMRNPNRFNMAAADLAVEGRILSSLDHPNILKVRAWGADGIQAYENGKHDSFFLILDKMEGTLDGKIQAWARHSRGETRSLGRKTDRPTMGSAHQQQQQQQQEQQEQEQQEQEQQRDQKQSLMDRTRYALQIASALDYLHDRECIYRDLKPQNVGIDSNGDVKIFDMGLARELPSSGGDREGTSDELFQMSGGVGTQRYAAPETALRKWYNLKADCYTWAVVFHELLSLERPYKKYSKEVHLDRCCRRGERPDMSPEWPRSIRNLMERAWSETVSGRPTMKRIRRELENILLVEEETELLLTCIPSPREGGGGGGVGDDGVVEYEKENEKENDDVPKEERRKDSVVVLELPRNFAILEKASLARKMTSNATAATSPETHEESGAFSFDSVSTLEHR